MVISTSMPLLSLAEYHDDVTATADQTSLRQAAKENLVEKPAHRLLLEQDAAADEDEEGSTYIVDLLIMGLDESALTESDALNAFGEIFMNDYNEIDDGYMTITSVSVEVVGQAERRGNRRNLRRSFSRLSMRLRASGPNPNAKNRPLIRNNTKCSRCKQRDLSTADDSVFLLLENYSSDLLERFPDIKFMEVLPERPE
jgi:hypothetical protein